MGRTRTKKLKLPDLPVYYSNKGNINNKSSGDNFEGTHTDPTSLPVSVDNLSPINQSYLKQAKEKNVNQKYSSCSKPTSLSNNENEYEVQFISQADAATEINNVLSKQSNANNMSLKYNSDKPTTSVFNENVLEIQSYKEDRISFNYDTDAPKLPKVKRKLFDISSSEDEDVIQTTASPFKVTRVIASAEKSLSAPVTKPFAFHSSNKINKSKNNIPFGVESGQILDNVNKILRTVLKIRYDMESVQEILQIKEINTINESTLQEDDNIFEILPIKNEIELYEFENKLSKNKQYRLNLVSELRRFSKKNLTATIRQMLRSMFDDSLLKGYSYIGQKKKKVFSALTSCTVIFEAVRKISQFQNVTNADIEAPIKVYIAGAAFRTNKNINSV